MKKTSPFGLPKAPDYVTDPPIGSIIAWHKSLSGVPQSLSYNSAWVECSGQTLNDPSSPLHGVVIPNLNTGNDTGGYFLRGATVSGTLQAGTVIQNGGSDQVRGVSSVAYADADSTDGNSCANKTVAGSLNSQTIAAQGSVFRPINMGVVWIMRVK